MYKGNCIVTESNRFRIFSQGIQAVSSLGLQHSYKREFTKICVHCVQQITFVSCSFCLIFRKPQARAVAWYEEHMFFPILFCLSVVPFQGFTRQVYAVQIHESQQNRLHTWFNTGCFKLVLGSNVISALQMSSVIYVVQTYTKMYCHLHTILHGHRIRLEILWLV
jgi:hypothetical protein